MRRSRPATSLALVTFASLACAGCRVFDASLLEELDAGSDAGPPPVDSGLDGANCALTLPPPRPDVGDGPDIGEVVYVIQHVSFDQRDDRWRTIGYDLDGLCSDPPEPVVECLPPAPSAPPEIDGVGGIDNAIGHNLFSLVLFALPDFQADTDHNLGLGIGVPIFRIRGWNGEPNDPLVDVTFVQSAWGTPGLPDGGAPDAQIPDGGIIYEDGGDPPLPRFEGNDYWWARADQFLAGDPERPRVRDDRAYVADDMLVVTLPDRFPLTFAGSIRRLVITLTDAVLTAKLSADHQRIERAVIAGRFPIIDVLDTLDSVGICAGTMEYMTIRRLTELGADVRATPGTGGPDVICDAISMGVEGTGVRAHFGGVSDLYGTPNACESMMGDAGVDAGAEDAGPDA